ncbi:unnamed protein product [Trypanosoma congolense IL3000]|uniref:WGS project CAEQ00000000 data, annotated contig 1049 n=1 Tax=Trypanosoma congolense (strain IL3000) TaxID=1068625 RepID=F9W3F9_TRYCI|nr:unnamed protein product [Trypanosoma congolense IL3000]
MIEGVTHRSLKDSFDGGSSTTEAGCNLVKGISDGILTSVGLEKSLWWGGGILTVRRGFEDQFNSENFSAGEIRNAENGGSKAFWTENPAKQVVHLKNASDAFKALKAIQEKIKEKVESIEQKIQACIGRQESGENSTEQTPTSPTCFDNVAKIAAGLKEKRALLARYQKVKGWIPPSSAFNAKIPFNHFGVLLTLL